MKLHACVWRITGCALFTFGNAHAAPPESVGGVIRFTGAVVMPTCVVQSNSGGLSLLLDAAPCGSVSVSKMTVSAPQTLNSVVLYNYD